MRLNYRFVGVFAIGCQDVLIDLRGTVWIGTQGGGLDRMESALSQKQYKFKHYRHADKNPASISDDVVRVLHEDRNGRVWIGTDGGGLSLIDHDSDSFM